MPKIKIAQYLFDRIKDTQVEYTFGIPGDYVLPLYEAQEINGLKTVVMTHEPSVGFAADAYARLKGLGVALVTYGSGALNMINATATAYAEESPLLVISGSPATELRKLKPLMHHCVKTFETPCRIFAEITAAQAILTNIHTAQADIDNVLQTTLKLSKPGYLEIPQDMVNQKFDLVPPTADFISSATPELTEALNEIISRLQSCRQPVIFAGVEIRRFRLMNQVVKLAEALNVPVVTSILGKACFPESHPNFIGTYFGRFGNQQVKDYVESSDCVLCLGTILTEMETAGYTAQLNPSSIIQITSAEIIVGYHTYPGINLSDLTNQLIAQISSQSPQSKKFTLPTITPEEIVQTNNNVLSVATIIKVLNSMLSDRYSIICDVSDGLYAGLSLKTDVFIAPGHYSTMGFGVPASIGAQLADPSRRPIVLVGDGCFQMTGMEISTAVKLGLNPIVIVFDNACYAMMKFMSGPKEIFKLPRWDYSNLAISVGADAAKADTKTGFEQALRAAVSSKKPFLIDAIISDDDISPTLQRLTDHFSKRVKAARA